MLFSVGGWDCRKEYSPYHVHPWGRLADDTVRNLDPSSNGTEKSTTKGASATFTCSCTTIGWVSAKGPTHGSAAIYINGIYQKTVSTYASALKISRSFGRRNSSFAKTSHVIKIVNLGTAGHARIDLEDFPYL